LVDDGWIGIFLIIGWPVYGIPIPRFIYYRVAHYWSYPIRDRVITANKMITTADQQTSPTKERAQYNGAGAIHFLYFFFY
jgi:hypothetical protein